MKILYVSGSDLDSGSGKGAFRLHQAFLELGHQSQLLMQRTSTDDPTISAYRVSAPNKALWQGELLAAKAITSLQRTRDNSPRSLNMFRSGLARRINDSDADVVQLHWLGNEAISVAEIGRIRKPLVWRLADVWPFSGAEHYSLGDDQKRFKEGYTRRNRQRTARGFDLDRWVWQRKRRRWKDQAFTVVCGSEWLAECARQSALMGSRAVEVIPTSLDTRVFRPVPKKQARDLLKLPPDKRLLLFGAIRGTSDQRKGYDLLRGALELFAGTPDARNAEVIVFGSADVRQERDLPLPSRFMGTLRDDISIVLLYSAADVMIVPSRQEAFGQTASEALACGTPVVCFDTSGLRDIVDHKENGYRAQAFEVDDLSNGISWVLNNGPQRLGSAGRQKAEAQFDVLDQARSYISLYERLLLEDRFTHEEAQL